MKKTTSGSTGTRDVNNKKGGRGQREEAARDDENLFHCIATAGGVWVKKIYFNNSPMFYIRCSLKQFGILYKEQLDY